MDVPYISRTQIHKNHSYKFGFVCAFIYLGLRLLMYYSAAFIALGSAGNALLLTWMNKRKIQQREALLAPYQNLPDGDTKAWIELGDRHPDFRYTI